MKTHFEEIKCPDCNTIQLGKVEHTIPFWSYHKECGLCGCVITESDWHLTRRGEQKRMIEIDNDPGKPIDF